MVHTKKTLIIAVVIAVLVGSWLLVVTSVPRTNAKQNALVKEAQSMMKDKVYKPAIPVLQQAIDLNPKKSSEIEELMADCYIALEDENKAISIYEGIVASKNADEKLYLRLAEMYIEDNEYVESLKLLKSGAEKLESEKLEKEYEKTRYRIVEYYNTYTDIQGFLNGGMTAVLDDKWGLLDIVASPRINFKYDKTTNFDADGKALVIDGGQATIIDKTGARLALCKEKVEDIVSLSNGIGGVQVKGKWYFVNSDFNRGETPYEYIGNLTNGRRAVKKDGKWYLLDADREIVTQAFADIKVDADGSCFSQDRAFAKKGNSYIMIDGDGNAIGTEKYEDARPFYDSFAAVKKGDKWLFIDVNGKEVLKNDGFEELDSFCYNVAAVKKDDKWGYINKQGELITEIAYAAAKPFKNGVAPVKIGDVWKIIALEEYTN